MKDKHLLLNLKKELSEELQQNIMPFWLEKVTGNAEDGFVSRITCDNHIVPDADKGVILYARMLWSYAAWFTYTGDKQIAERAEQVFRYFNHHFWDDEYGGVYWALDAKGKVKISRKYMYAQAFALYGYSEFYSAFDSPKACDYARELFAKMETKASDKNNGGYHEVFTRAWQSCEDTRLSEHEEGHPKSMNTHLHILEAYTTYYICQQNKLLRQRIRHLSLLFVEQMLRKDGNYFEPYFDHNWRSTSEGISFGHDIEATWLLCRAAEAIGEESLKRQIQEITIKIGEFVIENAIDADGGFINQQYADGSIDQYRHWWPQAEAIIGFLNIYELTGETKYLTACHNIWMYIKQQIIDKKNGDWHSCIHADGTITGKDKVDFWKTPYHNSRMALECIRRVEHMANTHW